jgi:hypothetical protein
LDGYDSQYEINVSKSYGQNAGNYVCSATNAAGTSTSGVASLTYGGKYDLVL